MFGWALPRRTGAAPVTKAFCAWLTSAARVAPRSETSIALPRDGARAPDPADRRAAADQPGQHRHGAEHPGDDVADRDAHLGRPAALVVGRAGDAHESAHGLDHEVVARAVGGGPRRAVAGDREVDERRVQLAQDVVIEAEAGEATRPEVLDEDVAAGQQAAQHLGTVGLVQVERDRALVAVDREVVGRGPRVVGGVADPGWAPATGRIALGRLDLDDVGAEIAEEHRAVRAGEDRRRVDDPQAGERTRPGRGWHVGDGGTPARRPLILAAGSAAARIPVGILEPR